MKLKSPDTRPDLLPKPAAWVQIAVPSAVGLLGLFISLFSFWIHPFGTVFPGFSDSRLNMYLLENSWLWILGHTPHGLFNPPFYYPVADTFFFGNLLVGFAPPYWLLRVCGLGPEEAFTAWFIFVCAANYALSYLFLRYCARVSVTAGTLGAWILAYSCSRIVLMYHVQLVPLIYVLGMIAGVWMYFMHITSEQEPPAVARPRRRVWIAIFYLSFVGQFWSEFYMVYFTALVLAIAGFWALFHAGCRLAFAQAIKKDGLFALTCATLSAVALWPIARGYLAVSHLVGLRRFSDISTMIPRPTSWFYLGELSIPYRWMFHSRFFKLPVQYEHVVGIGLLTTVICWIGLLTRKRFFAARLIMATVLSIILLTTMVADHFTFWRVIHAWLPGAAAIRAVVRIGMFMPIAGAIGLAWFIDSMQSRKFRCIALILAVICCAEQLVEDPTRPVQHDQPWVNRLTQQVDRSKKAFIVSISLPPNTLEEEVVHIDAMLASQRTGIPTINGYDGVFPPVWQDSFWNNQIATDAARKQFGIAIARWAAQHQMRPDNIQWIELPRSYRAAP